MEKYNWDTGLTTAQVDALQAKQGKKHRDALLVIDAETGLYDWTNFFCFWTKMSKGATTVLRKKWIQNFLENDGFRTRNAGTYVTAKFLKAYCIVEGIKCDFPYVPLVLPDYDKKMFMRVMDCHYNRRSCTFSSWAESIPAEKRNIVAYFAELTDDSKIGYKIGMGWSNQE
jgi:hypothetical protein